MDTANSWASRVPLPRSAAAKPRVAILGGGISGLTAAYRLASLAKDLNIPLEITLLEGTNRLGGHAYTRNRADGSSFEAGCELIDTRHTSILNLIGELGLKVHSRGTDKEGDDIYYTEGKIRSTEEFLEAYRPLAAVFRRHQEEITEAQNNGNREALEKFDRLSMENMLGESTQKSGAAPWVANLLRQCFAGEMGLPSTEISALGFLEDIGTDTASADTFDLYRNSDFIYRVEGGTQKLVDALEERLRALGVNIQTQCRVTELSQHKGKEGFNISYADGRSGEGESATYIDADYAISALPLPSLSKVPGVSDLLSEPQREALQNTRYSQLAKIGLELHGNPLGDLPGSYNGMIYTDKQFQNAWVSDDGDVGGNHTLTYFIGDPDFSRKIPQMLETIKAEFCEMLGKKPEEVFTERKPYIQDWTGEGQGCYVALTRERTHALSCFQEPLTGRFGLTGEFVPKFFGEDKNMRIGYMDCAIASAENEAARVIEVLSRQKLFSREKVASLDRPF